MVVHARTLEIFNEIGVAERAISQGQKGQQFNMVTRGKVRGALQLTDFGKGWSQFPYALVLEQSKTEKLMADYLSEKGISVTWGSEVTHFEDTGDGVTVFYKDKNGGTHQIEGHYLVGCDGAASMTRHQLGLAFEGDTEARLFYVADVKMESQLSGRHDAWFVMIENGFALFFPMEEEKRYRIIGTVPQSVMDKAQLQFSDIEQIIKNQVQVPTNFPESYWFSTYKVHSRMVGSFSKGRCFLAGDAAHIHTPAGGQGMNTGIQDAYNLAWKLAFVIKGNADEKLLDTYNEERYANAQRLLKTTDRMFDILAGTGWLSNFLRLYLFPLILKIATRTSFFRKKAFPLLSMIGVKYPESSLTIRSKIGKIEAGDRMPYSEVEGKSIYEYLKEPKHKLLYFGNPNNFDETAYPDPELVKCAFTQIPEVFEREKDFYVVLRPDNYIAYIGKLKDRVNAALSLQ